MGSILMVDNEEPALVGEEGGLAGQAKGLAAGPKSYIRGITLVAFLQLVQVERKTCTLKIQSQKGVGILHIRGGELLAAETGSLSGERAAHEIVCWPEPVNRDGGRLPQKIGADQDLH